MSPGAPVRTLIRRGHILVGVLVFIMVTSLLLLGVATFVVSHQTRMVVDSNYAKALDLAEAGIDFEFRKITLDVEQADRSPGGTYPLGDGDFTVYCTNRDGETPWVPNDDLYVYSTGEVGGVRRTVRASCKGYYPDGKFAIYSMDSISIWQGSAMNINGDLGSNGHLTFTATPGVTGSIYFYGPNAGWHKCSPSGFNVITNPNEVIWPTVSEIACDALPGGLGALAVTNNNSNASPPIVGNSITDSVALPAGNYYVTHIYLTGSKKITFDNRFGPVNLWIGPEGGARTCKFRGGSSVVSKVSDPSKGCNIYVATKSGIDLAGNATVDALIYAYNRDALGNAYGYAANSGTPIINGQLIANRVDINGNITVNYLKSQIKPSAFGYYGYDNSWLEVGAR